MIRSQDITEKVMDLLMDVAKKAYNEGRKHSVVEEDITGVFHMLSFEDTEIYKDIMENWK